MYVTSQPIELCWDIFSLLVDISMGKLNRCPRNAHTRSEIGRTLMLCQSRSAKKSTSCLKSFRKVRLDHELFSAPGVKHGIRLSWHWPTLSTKSTKHWQKNGQRINCPRGCRRGMCMATILADKNWLILRISMRDKHSIKAFKEFSSMACKQFGMRIVILSAFVDGDGDPAITLWV